MNLFDMNENTRQLPLASRMRPEKLDENSWPTSYHRER